MKKTAIRILSIVFILTIVLSSFAFADTKSSAYIDSTAAAVIKSGTNISVYFTITGKNIMDVIGATYIYLYVETDNGWSLVKTFDSNNSYYTSDMLGTNTSIKDSHVTYTVGNYTKHYYAVVHFYAERNGGSDTIIQYTPIN